MTATKNKLQFMSLVFGVICLAILARPARWIISRIAESGMSFEDFAFHATTRTIFWGIALCSAIILTTIAYADDVDSPPLSAQAASRGVNVSMKLFLTVSAVAVLQITRGRFNYLWEGTTYVMSALMCISSMAKYSEEHKIAETREKL